MKPNLSQVHIDRAIAGVAIGYRNNDYVIEQIGAVVGVDKKSDKYYISDKADWYRDVADTDRRPGTIAPRGGYTLSNDTYTTKQMTQGMAVPDEIVEQADDPIKPMENAGEWCMSMVRLRLERYASALLFVSGTWGTDKTVTNTWDDYTNSDPANDVSVGKRALRQNIGRKANTLLMGGEVMDKLLLHPDAIDRFKHTTTGILTEEQVALWLGVERVIVGEGIYNSAAEGQTAVMANIWGKNALLAFMPTSNEVWSPQAVTVFRLNGLETRNYYEDAPQQTVVETKEENDVKVTATDAGYYFDAVVA